MRQPKTHGCCSRRARSKSHAGGSVSSASAERRLPDVAGQVDSEVEVEVVDAEDVAGGGAADGVTAADEKAAVWFTETQDTEDVVSMTKRAPA
jgi:type IV secretory pathway TrbL component